MKKLRIVLIICLLAMSLVLSACGKKDPDAGNTQETGTPTAEMKDEKITDGPVTEDVSPTLEPTEEVTASPEPTEEPEVTSEITEGPEATEEPTDSPEPTEEVTATPEPTEEPEVTPEPVSDQDDEQREYPAPEPLMVGAASIKDSIQNDEYKTLASISYDKIVLDESVKEKYKMLSLGVDVLNLSNKDMAEDTLKSYQESIDEGYVLDMGYYSLYDEYDIVRADSYVLSLENTSSSYTGGAHPASGIGGCVFDTETGERLKISDICNDIESLPEKIFYTYSGKYGEDGESEENGEEILSYIKKAVAEDRLSFTLGYEGVTLYFSPYEVGTYAQGNISVTIPYTETVLLNGENLVGLFKKKYSTVPEKYMRSISFSKPVDILGIDGVTSGFSSLTVTGGMMVDEYSTSGLKFYINGSEVYEDTEIGDYYSHELYLVSVGEKKYIFVHTVHSSEDDSAYLYEIADGKVQRISGTDEYGYAVGYLFTPTEDGESKWVTDKMVFDPENITLIVRNDIIGTNFLKGIYQITSEGTIEKKGKFYDFTYNSPLTLKKDFKAGMIDPELMFNTETEATGEFDIEVELKAGDKIYLQKTDGDRQVFFSTDSGEWGTFTMDEKMFMLRGESINDYFDGIGYAD